MIIFLPLFIIYLRLIFIGVFGNFLWLS